MDKKTTKKKKGADDTAEEKPARKIKVIKPNSEVLLVEAKKAEEPVLAESAQPIAEAKAEPKKKTVKKAVRSAAGESEETAKASKTKKSTAKKATKAADTGEAKPKRKYTRKTKIEIVDIELASDIKPVEYVVAETKPLEPEAIEPAETAEEKSPVFKELAVPKLPMLPSENRARLQMQSPNRVFFYWSVKDNPYEKLHKAFGGRAADYRLTAKLVNLSQNREEVYPVEGTGSWWFNVDADTRYRAEIGFAAHNRPFVRLMFSNTVETPRSSPSPRYDWTPDFYIPAEKFAQALDASGYAADARELVEAERVQETPEVAAANDQAAFDSYQRITGTEAKVSANEIRYVLFALASGVSLESLRGYISPSLYSELESIAANLGAQEILAILHEHFGFNPLEEEYEEVQMSGAVYGASIVNFPKGLRKKKAALPPGAREHKGPAPVSSFVNR